MKWKGLQMLRLQVALCDVLNLRLAIKKEACCSSRAPLLKRPRTGFLESWLLEQDSNL